MLMGAAALCLVAAGVAAAGEEAPDARRLYEEFEALNTIENLTHRFVGGKPPEFVSRQAELLRAIAERPAAEAVPILLRIATEHIERIEDVGAAKFRQSPLQAIQVPLVDAMSRHATHKDVRASLARLSRHPLIKEYARGRALDAIAEQLVADIGQAEDPKGERRARTLLDTMFGDLTLPEVLHAPGRLRALARRAPALAVEGDPTAHWRALAAAADSEAKRYAADAALALSCAQREGTETPIAGVEKDMLVEACGRWLKDFRPVAAKEKYPSDLLGEALIRLGARLKFPPLDKPLRDAGLLPPE